MRLISFVLVVVGLSCLAATGVDAAPARQRAQAQSGPQNRAALYQNCRAMVFRRFGWNEGTGRVVMYSDYLFEQTELCVRNGGRI
jgi:hypothetical protein